MVAQALRSPSEAPSEPHTEELRAVLERLLDDARAGKGGTLVVDEGYAAVAVDLASDFVVLRADAVESEAGLPYAVLADVLRPVLHLLAELPEPQSEALRAAFALGTPTPGARFAVCAGTLNLLAAAGPALVAIEHAQWIDEASSEALRFAFRRLDGTRVAAVLGTGAGAALAAEPSTDPRHLLAEAGAARAAGKPDRALHLLERALAATNDPLVRADAHHLRGTISMWRAAPAQAARQLLTESERIESLDPAKAAWMSADAAWAAFMGGELAQGLAAAEKASALAAGGGIVDVFCTGLLGVARMLGGRSREAKPLVGRFAPLLDDTRFLEQASTAVLPAALALVWLDEHAKAREAFATLVEFARTNGRPAMLPHALVGLSELEFRTGDWVAARAAAADAVRLAEETGQPVAHAFGLLALARVDAPQGREADCTAHVFESVRLAPSGAGAVLAFAGTRLGALELALGRSEATISHLEQVAERTENDLLDPGVIQWPPDLIEALVRCGRCDDARRVLDAFEARARDTGRVWAIGAAARCRGLLAPTHEFADAFLEARERHDETGDPFEQARTELCFGERLRRARRRVDSRPPLRAALAIFERLGAAPWAERTRTELRATGETVRSRGVASTDELTPQELEIARIVAQGATNREAAAALYVSVKTIEAHLGRIYRKLRVRSRTELARLLA